MTASYSSCVGCVLLALVYSVISVKIGGMIKKNFDFHATEVEVSEYINGDNWDRTTYINLNRLVDGDTLPILTLINFKFLNELSVNNISLTHVPVFENISADYVSITANHIKHIPTNAFAGARVRRLNMENNQIQSMSDRSINVDVQHLYLCCNNLANFSPAWFQEPSNILLLDLSSNRIEHIQDHAFDRMTRLYELLLGCNHITRIGSEAFSPGITNLYLQFNDIEHLTPDMFARRDKPVYYLNLQHNQLSFLSEALLVQLKPAHSMLDGNPWQCQCLWDIERWMRELNLVQDYLRNRPGEPVCVVPLSFQKVCVPTVDKELQQTYARGLSPKYLAEGCSRNSN